ncbi:hypothetical protein D3C81_1390900 [compost metagenome]
MIIRKNNRFFGGIYQATETAVPGEDLLRQGSDVRRYHLKKVFVFIKLGNAAVFSTKNMQKLFGRKFKYIFELQALT